MKAIKSDLPERLWLFNSLIGSHYALRFDRRLWIELETALVAGDSEFVLPMLSIRVCNAVLVGRPYVQAISLPTGNVELLADGSRLWSGKIQAKSIRWRSALRKDECHFGAKDSEASEKEIGVFVPTRTIFKLAFRGVGGAVPARVTVGLALAEYTSSMVGSKSLSNLR